MNLSLAERDQSVVAYLLESEEAGRAPSVEEIAAAFGFSKGAAWRSLQRLMEAGAVKSNPRRYRSYRAVRDAPIVPFDLSTIPAIALRRELDRRAGLTIGGAA